MHYASITLVICEAKSIRDSEEGSASCCFSQEYAFITDNLRSVELPTEVSAQFCIVLWAVQFSIFRSTSSFCLALLANAVVTGTARNV